MLRVKVLFREPVLAILICPPVLAQLAGSTPEMVTVAAHQPVPADCGIPRSRGTQRAPLAWERVPAATLLPACSVYALQAANPPQPITAVPATMAPMTRATRRDRRLFLRLPMIPVPPPPGDLACK